MCLLFDTDMNQMRTNGPTARGPAWGRLGWLTASVWWKALLESVVGNDNFKCRLFMWHRYEPEEDQWTNGSWPSLRKARLAHGVCVVEGGPYGGRIYTAGGSPEVNPNSRRVVLYYCFNKFVKLNRTKQHLHNFYSSRSIYFLIFLS